MQRWFLQKIKYQILLKLKDNIYLVRFFRYCYIGNSNQADILLARRVGSSHLHTLFYVLLTFKSILSIDTLCCIQYNINKNDYKIEYLILPNGKAPLIEWLNSLDSISRKRINQRILRIEDGNFGDYKKLSELRFAFGKGYRIYYTEENNKIILLINGGDKSKQSKDIEKAHDLLEQWRGKCNFSNIGTISEV